MESDLPPPSGRDADHEAIDTDTDADAEAHDRHGPETVTDKAAGGAPTTVGVALDEDEIQRAYKQSPLGRLSRRSKRLAGPRGDVDDDG